MKILLIYEVHATHPDMFLFRLDVGDDDWAWIQRTHGRCQGDRSMDAEDAAACERLSTYLVTKKPPMICDGHRSAHTPIRSPAFDYLVRTGYRT